METIDFYIQGVPKALKRHRMTRGGRVYDPSSTDKKLWMDQALPFCPTKALQGALNVELQFVMPRPKAHFKTNGLLKPQAPKHHLHTPDLDNLVKFVLDAMYGEFYDDDSQIISITCSKTLGIEQDDCGTFVSIKQIL
jgi:Holliday junction resolvase RusA-like endonuclease